MLPGLRRVAWLNDSLSCWAGFSLSRSVILLEPLLHHRLIFVTKLCALVYLVCEAEHQVYTLAGTPSL